MKKRQVSLIEELPWDSTFFKRKIARLKSATLTEGGVQAALQECERKKIQCLYARLDSDAQKNVTRAEENGFSLVGTRVTYELSLLARGRTKSPHVSIRKGVTEDKKALGALSLALSRESRFFRDERFGPSAAKRLYAAWIEKLLRGASSSAVFVAEVDRRCAGFVGASVKNGLVHIELVVVGEKFRGKHIGFNLMRECVKAYERKGHQKFLVVTQGNNIAAQRLYQSCGFRIVRMALDYHKWFD